MDSWWGLLLHRYITDYCYTGILQTTVTQVYYRLRRGQIFLLELCKTIKFYHDFDFVFQKVNNLLQK